MTLHYELGIVRTTITRPEPAQVARLAQFDVATLHEAMEQKGLMQAYMRPVYPQAKLCGPAVTILVHPLDNWMMHVAAEQLQPGDVAVAACSAECNAGFFGDLLATAYKARGATGLVIDAGVRDVADLEKMGFAVFSKAISAQGTAKARLGSVNIPIHCAGALVHPGDVIVADADGVVVVPQDQIDRVLARASERVAQEAQKRAQLAQGQNSLDLYGMREALAQAGLKYITN